MPPVENQPIKPNPQGAEFGLEPPQLYGFTGDQNVTPNPYQFTGDGKEVKSGPQIYMGPVGQDWGPRIGPSERRIDQMPPGPQKDAALARETNVLFNVPVALKAYRDDIKAADAIDQTDVLRRNTANVALLKDNQTQLAQAKAMNASPEQMNSLLGKQQELQNAQKLIVGDYYAPATTRINAGLALITTGQDMLVDYGQNLISEALKLRPELRDNPLFNKNLEAARQACIKNREAAFTGEVKDPYQFTGDGSVPGGIPQKRPGIPGQPGRGPDGRPLPDGNPGFTPIPGYDAPPQQQVQPFPQFKRGGETPPDARKDLPQQKPKEDFTPPAQPPAEKGLDKGVWDKMNDGQKLLAAALAAFLGYKLVQRGNRIAAERSRDAGNEALGKTPENAAKLKEAIERAGKEFARDNVVKAKLLKEGENAGKYEVTRPDGKKEFMSETDFKDKYSETGKPGEYKSWLSDRTKAVQLPDLGELNAELGLGKQADRKMWAIEENGEVKLLTDKEFKQSWREPNTVDKASWIMEAERKLTPEQRAEKEAARVEAERVAAEKEAARVAAEKEAARVEAERVAAEKETARVAAEKEAARVEAERVAAEKETARVAAEKEAARVEAERVAAEKETARVAAEKEAARVEAERVAAEKETARVAAEKEAARVEAERVAAEKETARVAAEKEAARVEAERVAAEKETARVAAEKEAARVEAERVAAEKETARVAAEKEAARVEAERVAAEKLAAEGRFKPAAGTEIVPGIKVDQKVNVEGVNWTAAGKVEDRVVFKKDSGMERSKTPQEMKTADFNRVEISGEKGIFFQRKGTNTMYQYIPLDGKQGAEPGPGNGFIFKLDGVEAKPLGSPVVRAMLKAGIATPEVTTPAPIKEEVKTPDTAPAEPKRSKRGGAPAITEFGGVEYKQNADGTQSSRLEVAGKPLVGTEKNWKELLTEPEVKALQDRKVELELAQKDRKLATEEAKELEALRDLEPRLNNPKTHAEIIERLGGKRPSGGFRAGELRGGLIGGAILATAVLGWFAGSNRAEEYQTPERSRLGGN